MNWIPFNGRAKRTDKGWLLISTDGTEAVVEMQHSDVQVREKSVLVLVGSKAREIFVPPKSLANSDPIQKSLKQCFDGRSRCVGGIELCCSTDEVAGPCMGRWNDCDQSGNSDQLSKAQRALLEAAARRGKVPSG